MQMLTEEHGNLLEAPADALVNTVNTVGIMGRALLCNSSRPTRATSVPTSPPASAVRCAWARCSLTKLISWTGRG
jgi:hypothetical protein